MNNQGWPVANERTKEAAQHDDKALLELRNVWETLAQDDPLWAILSDPNKTNRRWDIDEFFATGKSDVEGLIDTLGREKIDFDPACAVDFGCGIGRLTQALAPHFNLVYGIDISAGMVRLAPAFNRHNSKCNFIHHTSTSLQFLANEEPSFIYSTIVLQHIPLPLCVE